MNNKTSISINSNKQPKVQAATLGSQFITETSNTKQNEQTTCTAGSLCTCCRVTLHLLPGLLLPGHLLPGHFTPLCYPKCSYRNPSPGNMGRMHNADISKKLHCWDTLHLLPGQFTSAAGSIAARWLAAWLLYNVCCTNCTKNYCAV